MNTDKGNGPGDIRMGLICGSWPFRSGRKVVALLNQGKWLLSLRAMGYSKETQIYVASGQVYGSQNRMAPLRNMFPNLVTKEELETQDELDGFKKACDKLGSPRFLSVLEVRCVCDDSWRQLCKTDHWCSEIHGTLA